MQGSNLSQLCYFVHLDGHSKEKREATETGILYMWNNRAEARAKTTCNDLVLLVKIKMPLDRGDLW